MMNKLQYKIGMKKGLVIAGAVILGLMALISFAAQYSHEETHTVTVIRVTAQQHVSGGGENNGVTTYYKYLVSTDKGVFEINPSGVFASNCFGNLEEGKTYTINTRGFSVPLFGMYPYIIQATPV